MTWGFNNRKNPYQIPPAEIQRPTFGQVACPKWRSELHTGRIQHSTSPNCLSREADKQENELSVKNGWRILSAYTLRNDVKIWVITEADRSSTCFLLPSEY